ncbi:tetratricopeptide repeat protein [Candidatus Fermentibacteria bacterium]|nr:tetratricopeptide repeat protein [Candidatus Fermentibacteria bacterium]
MNVLNQLAFELHRTDPHQTRAYVSEALDLATSLDLTACTARSHQVFGIYHWTQGDYREALRSHFIALTLYEGLGDSSGLARSYNNIGAVYYSRSLYDEALDYFMKSLSIYENRPITPEVAFIYINIGVIMRLQQNYDQALSYYLKALDFYRQEGYDRDRAAALAGIGAVYLDRARYDEAIEYYRKALEIRNAMGDRSGIAACLQSIGVIHQRQGRSALALESLTSALTIAADLGNRNLLATTHVVMGTMLVQLQRFDQAERHLESGLRLASDIGGRRVAMEAYRGLTEVATSRSDYRAALRLHQQYAALSDSIYNAEKTQAIEDMHAKYEAAKLESEIRDLHLDSEKKDVELDRRRVELSKQRIVIYSLATVFVTIVVFSILLSRQLSQNKRNAILLARQNHQLTRQQEILNRQTAELTQLNATKDRFFAIIAHDLRSPLASLLSTTKSLSDCCDSVDGQSLRHYLETINTSAARLHRLLENLLQWASAQSGTLHAEVGTVSVRDAVTEVVGVLCDTAEAKGVALSSSVAPTLRVVADANMLRVVLRNLVDNAIKFSGGGSEVSVTAAEVDGAAEITVVDHGVGIPATDLANLFQLDRSPRTRGTTGEQGSGLGLTLCRDFITTLGGRIWAESTHGQGSTFHVVLPLSRG